MPKFSINEDEYDALIGQRYVYRLVYAFALRPYMDYRTGIVGIKRKVSYQSIAEDIEEWPSHGFKREERLSVQQARKIIDGLERIGLVERNTEQNKGDRRLILKLPLATTDSCAQKQGGSKGAVSGQSKEGRRIPIENKELYSEGGSKGAVPNLGQGGIPPLSYNPVEEEEDKPLKSPSAGVELPSWLLPQLWEDFKEHRKLMKKPMTLKAEELAIKKLTKLVAQGQNGPEMVETAIERGWMTFYPKPQENGYGNRPGGNGTNKTNGKSGTSGSRSFSAPERVARANARNFPGDPFFDPKGKCEVIVSEP